MKKEVLQAGVPRVIGSRQEVVVTVEELTKNSSKGRTYKSRKRVSWNKFLWEQHNGEIPEGMVVYANVPKGTIPELSDLELISRGELLARNKFCKK